MPRFLLPALVSLLLVSVLPVAAGVPDYPETRTVDVVDEYFGTTIADPYRWLEESEAPEVQEWVDAQNAVTRAYLDQIPGRDKLEARLQELTDYERVSLPTVRGDVIFYTKNTGLQNQSVWYKEDRRTGETTMLLDPNTLREDGTGAVRSPSFSPDGKYLAYGISWSGSDWSEIHVLNTEIGEHLDEVIHHVKFSTAAWLPDGSGFYYSRQPEPGTVPEGDEHYFMKVHFHRLGTDPKDDPMIFEKEEKDHGVYAWVTLDGKWLTVGSWGGGPKTNEYYVAPLGDDPTDVEFTGLMTGFDHSYGLVGSHGDVLYFTTNWGAPRERLIAVDMKHPEREHWKVVIPEGRGTLESVSVGKTVFYVSFMENAHELLSVYSFEGEKLQDVKLPSIGRVSVSTHPWYEDVFVSFSSFLQPTTIYRYDPATRELASHISPDLKFDPERFTVRQVWFESKDGTKVPMFLVHKRGLTLSGENPTLMYGYGGFNVSRTPRFSLSRILWLEQGGVYADVTLRGGGEFGQEWHEAGMLDKKQNVFDDFIAAGEYLIDHGYTRSEKLAIQGGSNGGLLTAACMLQRTDLFGVVLTQVPVVDMLRYHLFTVARYWIPEYGSSEDPEQFEFLLEYSPLHNVVEGEHYPSTLITTADTDDRVHPGQAKKYAATVQKANASNNPVLLRVETRAGHGAGKPTEKWIQEAVDIYGFALSEMGATAQP